MTDDTTLENRSKPAEGEKKIAAPDQHNFWQNDKDYGATDTRPSLFEKELTEEQLLKDPRWIKASREIYKLNNKGDEAALAKLDSMSDAEIAQEGLSYYGQFNYNMANMAYETAQFTRDATPEQKKAFLFMMDAYDHKNQSLAGWGRAIGNMLWDPTTYVGLGTFGVGVAAREGAKTAAKTSLKEILKKAVTTGLTAEIKTELKNNAALQTVKAGAKIGVIEGAAYAAADDIAKQKIEMDTLAANGSLVNDFRSGNFSFSRLLERSATGAAFGGTIGGTAPVVTSAIGKRLKSIFGFNASPATALKEVMSADGKKVMVNPDGTIHSINGQVEKPGTLRFNFTDDEIIPIQAMAGGAPTPNGNPNWKSNLPPLPNGRKSAESWGSANESTVAQDIMQATISIPNVLWKAVYDPTAIKLDPFARLAAKFVKANYETFVTLGKYVPFWNAPLMRRFENLEKLDVNSRRYIYPITDRVDVVIEKHLRPMFSAGAPGPNGGPAARGGLDDIKDSRALAAQLKDIGEQIRVGADPKTFDSQLQSILNNLPTLRNNINAKISPIEAELSPIETAISQIPVALDSQGNPKQSLKKARVDTLLEFVGIIKNQGTQVVNTIDNAIGKITKINNIPSKNTTFGDDLIKIATEMDKKLSDSVLKSEEILEGSLMRTTGKKSDGSIAKVENIRQLKRSIDEQYINPHVRRLGIMKPKQALENNENFFLKTASHWKQVWDKESNSFIPLGRRTVEYVRGLSEYIGELYAYGDEQDAAHGIRLLRYHMGADSNEVVPATLFDEVTNFVQKKYFNGIGLDSSKDPHFQRWLDSVRAAATRDHAPDVSGPRDTQEWYAKNAVKWLSARMYPQNQALEYDKKYGQYIAAPYRSEAFTRPAMTLRQNVWAYLTGRKVVPISEVPGLVPKDNTAEKEIGTTIKGSRFFGLWWDAMPQDGNKFKHFFTGAPSILKAPVNIVMSPLALGWWGTKNILALESKAFGWSFVKKPLIATGIVTGLAGAGNWYGENYHKDNPYGINTITGGVSSVGFQAARLGVDALLLPLRGSIWVAKNTTAPVTGFDNYLGLQPEYFSTGFYADLYSNLTKTRTREEIQKEIDKVKADDKLSAEDKEKKLKALQEELEELKKKDPAKTADKLAAEEKAKKDAEEAKKKAEEDAKNQALNGQNPDSSAAIPALPSTDSGNHVDIRQHGDDTGPSPQESAADREKEEKLKKLRADVESGRDLSATDSIELSNLEKWEQQRKEAKNNASPPAGTSGKTDKPAGAVMTADDMRKQLEKDKAYIETFTSLDNSPNNNIKGKTLTDIDSAIAGLGGDSPSDAAKDAAIKQIADINKIRENYVQLQDRIDRLKDFEKFVRQSDSDETTLADINEMRNVLIAAKRDPEHLTQYAIDVADKYLGTKHDDKGFWHYMGKLGKIIRENSVVELQDPKHPLYSTFNAAGMAGYHAGKGLLGRFGDYWNRMTSGQEGSKQQTLWKFGGGIVGAWMAMSFIGDWIDQTPGLNFPIVRHVLKLALFVGLVMVGAKFMESFMDTKAAIQTDDAGKYVPSSFTNTKYNIEAEAGNKPASSSRSNSVIELGGSASTQSHRGGTPQGVSLNPEQNALLQATQENARDASAHVVHGSGNHTDQAVLRTASYIAVGTGNHAPYGEDPRLAKGFLVGYERIPHDNDDGLAPVEIVALGNQTKINRPAFALAGPEI